ncbi:Ran-binding protein 3-like protein, partial [Bos mutus]
LSTMQRKGSSHLFNSVHTCRLKLPQEQQHQEKSVIAQPIFVFEKREQTFKRPADDILYEAAERECNEFSRKRVRASSFTWHTTDSQNQGVKKNNVFMTSNSVQRNVDLNSAEQCPVKHSELVLRPAILQPPQAQGYIKVRKSFGDHVLESCKVKEKNKSKIYEGNSYLLSENLPNARISMQLSTNQNALGTTSLRCQPSEDKYSTKSCSSDFVFGENMVERVLGTQKLTQPQLESDLYIKEKPFKFTLKIPINSPNSRTDTIENISLIESAAAFSFKPSPKCLLEKIDIITGEEAEHNVLEINCKLFRFNKTTQSWTERGRGALRLNDTARSDCGTFQSRLIMRNQGSLRLILNSKLWAQMEIQRANHKNLQITATDLEDCNVKVFLIQASAKDTGRMHAAIHHRLVALRSFDKRTDANQTESQSETVLQQCNYDSCDEDEEDLIQATKARSDSYRWTHRQSVACS